MPHLTVLTDFINRTYICWLYFRFVCKIFIPPAKRSFRGVYCFQPVRHSVIRDSVNIWISLLNNLSSFCLICFKFSPHLHHQTIHVWYEFRGQRVSIARVMGLFKSSYNMFAIVLKDFKYILCEINSSYSFQCFLLIFC